MIISLPYPKDQSNLLLQYSYPRLLHPSPCFFCALDRVSLLVGQLVPHRKYVDFVYYNLIQLCEAMKSHLSSLCLLLLLVYLLNSKPYTCEFGHLYSKSSHYRSTAPKPHEVLMPQSARRMLAGTMQPMRITLNTDDLSAVRPTSNGEAVTTLAKLNFIKKAMMVSEVFYESRLKVSAQSSIDIPSYCTDDFSPPASDVTNDIANSDMHIYVLYITDSTKQYGATGVSCAHVSSSVTYPDTTLRAGKPVMGRMIFNTYQLVDSSSTLTNRLFASVTATALHETLHILGFDESLYQYYMDPSGNLHTGMTEQVTLHASRSDNYLLKTPFVTAWTQAHFGCNSLTGMALENEDGGVKGSHWERLAMYDQIMTGTSLGAQKSFTGLTFAMLKDMGWYTVDDTFNDTTNYGYQKGCSFFHDACYAASPDQKYFCSEADYVNVSACSTTYTGKATCSEQAGLMADQCGLFQEYFYCVDPDANGDGYMTYTLEDFETDSFCIKGTMATVGISSKYQSRCYPFTCDEDTMSIVFKVGVYNVYCLQNQQGAQKTIPEMQGYIECPTFSDFCVDSRKFCPNWCSQHGFCTRGVCNCYFDDTVVYSGDDCSISTCTSTSQFYDPATSSCTTACSSGTYANTQSRTCMPCSSDCGNCRDEPTICTTCLSTPEVPKYYDETTDSCVSACPDGTYLDTDDRCKACDSVTSLCATCVTDATWCLSCTGSNYWTTVNTVGRDDGTCNVGCPNGSFGIKDNVNMECVASCPNELYFDGTACIYCPTGYKVVGVSSNACVASCGTGYWTDDVRKVCDTCDSSCAECYDRYPENCTKCKTTGTFIYLHEYMCIESCPKGYYENSTSGTCEVCTVTLNCSSCSFDGVVVTCVTCKYENYLHADNTCTTTCDPTFYANSWNHTCDPCHTDCKDCTGPDQSQCVNCDTGKFFLTNTTGSFCLDDCPTEKYVRMTSSCESCHQSCLTCSGLTSANCESCPENYFLESNRCRYVCSPGKYPNRTSYTCEGCNSLCTYCFGETVDNCTQCVSPYVLYNYTCTASCPEGEHVNDYNVCEISSFGALLPSLTLFGWLIMMIVW